MGFFGTLVFFIVVLVGCFWIGMPGEFLAGAVLFFTFFWIIGLIPPILIRFAFARKPLSRGAAIGLTILLWFVNVFVLAMIRGQGLTTGGGANIWLVGLTFCTYNVLRMRGKDAVETPAPAEPVKVTGSGKTNHTAHVKATAVSSIKENSTAMNDDAFYDEVAKEIEAKNLIPGMWTRAFAEADGDENRAKAIYIKRRVAQLSEIAKQAIMPMGGDVKAVSWDVVNKNLVRNTYANGDVTMSNKDTCRMWLYNANPCGKKKWADAMAYCGKLTYAGYSDWRLPDKYELSAQLSQKGCFADVQRSGYWSGTTESAWGVYMDDGYVGSYDKTTDLYVWPVRCEK